jgi:hypothetical protein
VKLFVIVKSLEVWELQEAWLAIHLLGMLQWDLRISYLLSLISSILHNILTETCLFAWKYM